MKSMLRYGFVSLWLVVLGCKLDELPGDKTFLEKPSAAFSVTNDGCTATCPITFTSQDVTAASYLWEISDGSTSTQPGFVKTFTTAGTYTVRLTVANKAGSNTRQQTVTVRAIVNPAATADFSFSGGDCSVPCEVTFTNKSSNATSYQWNFGDGNTSIEVNPRHTYQQGGTFTVKLTAIGPGGTSDKVQQITTQAPVVSKIWDKTFGGSANDVLYEVVSTTDGGFLVGGYSSSGTSVDKSQPSRGNEDYWVVKIDASGTRKWDRTFGGSSNDFLDAVAVADNGGFLLGGHSYSGQESDKTELARGLGDYWVVKVTADGTKEWDRRFGGSSLDFLHSVVYVKSDGGFLLGGQSNSGVSGDKTEASKGNTDYWVVKVDADGTKKWDKTFGGTELEELTSMVATTDGGFVLAGYSASPQGGNKTEPSKGSIDFWVVKIDAMGTKVWDRTFGGNGDDKLNALTATADGGLVLVGSSSSDASGDKSQASRGNTDYWVVKLKFNGEKEWDRTFGGSGRDEAFSVVANSNGSLVVGGHSSSGVSGEKSEPSKGNQELDYWVIKIDASGTKQWDKTFGGAGKEEQTSLVASPSDGSLVLGGFSSSDQTGDKTQPSKGQADYWVLKFKSKN